MLESHARFPLLSFVAALALAACGSPSSSGTSGGGSSTAATSGASSSGAKGTSTTTAGSSSGGSSTGASASSTGGSSTASAGSNGGSSTGGAAYTGSIILYDSPSMAGGSDSYSALADFVPTTAPGSTACAGTQVGSCCYIPPATTTTGGTGAAVVQVSAGDITLSASGTLIGTLSFTGTGGTYYYGLSSSPGSTFHWTGGDTLDAVAAGATVGTFSTSVVAVTPMANLSPAISSNATSVSLSADWPLSWTPDTSAGESVSVIVYGTTAADTSAGSIRCKTADSDGSLTVPGSLLANFQTTDSCSVSVSRTATASATGANAAVSFISGTNVSGPLTFH